MERRLYGYARVSSREQNEGRQLEALKAAGVNERDVFLDKKSGKDFEREQYMILLKCLREGDLLIIPSIDRLGRNYDGIKNAWQHITHDIKADIRVLDMPLLDTTAGDSNDNKLDRQFIADLTLQILSYVATKERDNIKLRQKEGIKLMKEQNRPHGRPKIQRPSNFDEIYLAWRANNITAKKAMEKLGLKKDAFYKFVKEQEFKSTVS